jgi:hypothetical protein
MRAAFGGSSAPSLTRLRSPVVPEEKQYGMNCVPVRGPTPSATRSLATTGILVANGPLAPVFVARSYTGLMYADAPTTLKVVGGAARMTFSRTGPCVGLAPV